MSKYACPYRYFESPDSNVSEKTTSPTLAWQRFPILPLLTRGIFPSAHRPWGKKGFIRETLDTSLEAGAESPLFNAIVLRNQSSPRPRKRTVSSAISVWTVGSYCRRATGIDGGARKLPQKDFKLQSKSPELGATRIRASLDADTSTREDQRRADKSSLRRNSQLGVTSNFVWVGYRGSSI
jgi:hypothetical protein